MPQVHFLVPPVSAFYKSYKIRDSEGELWVLFYLFQLINQHELGNKDGEEFYRKK